MRKLKSSYQSQVKWNTFVQKLPCYWFCEKVKIKNWPEFSDEELWWIGEPLVWLGNNLSSSETGCPDTLFELSDSEVAHLCNLKTGCSTGESTMSHKNVLWVYSHMIMIKRRIYTNKYIDRIQNSVFLYHEKYQNSCCWYQKWDLIMSHHSFRE